MADTALIHIIRLEDVSDREPRFNCYVIIFHISTFTRQSLVRPTKEDVIVMSTYSDDVMFVSFC
jgi:hypothetical protein